MPSRRSNSTNQRATVAPILRKLRSHADPEAVKGMARYGITSGKVFGISAPILRAMAKEIGPNHTLALQLWSTGFLEARVLAALIEDPEAITEAQMERWAKDFDNWAICDTCCGSVFDRTPYAWGKAVAWSRRKEEFIKRAGFALMAWLAVHDKRADDKHFFRFLSIIKREANDERNFVKKAVNWALRQIGKRNIALNKLAVETARDIQRIGSSSGRWIASDALRELTSISVRVRLRKKRSSHAAFR